MSTVIQRQGTRIENGMILHDDIPMSWDDADKIAGRRLDRRKNYAVINGQVCSAVNWTGRCTGCSNGHEDRGGGCEECGYHGVVRCSQWFPDDGAEPARAVIGDARQADGQSLTSHQRSTTGE